MGTQSLICLLHVLPESIMNMTCYYFTSVVASREPRVLT